MFIEQTPCINCGSESPFVGKADKDTFIIKCQDCDNGYVNRFCHKQNYSTFLMIWNHRNSRRVLLESYTEALDHAESYEHALYYRRVVNCLQNGGYLNQVPPPRWLEPK